MKIEEVLDLYDDAYAASYDARFLLLPWGQQASEFELSLIRRELGETGSYLDVACGTGWFLSQFPGRDRAGLDISPAMLAKAASVNPDAYLRRGNYLDDQPDWHDRWDLISCMWFAYCYAETVADVERLIANMARWTTPTGAVLLPVCDYKALGLDPYHFTDFPYKSAASEFGGFMYFTSITWTWEEPGSENFHTHLVAPHEEHLIEVFSRHFKHVEIHHYPTVLLDVEAPEPWVWNRKAILARHKRGAGDDAPSRVVVHPAPTDADADPQTPSAATVEEHPSAPVEEHPPAPVDSASDGTAVPPQSESDPSAVIPDRGAQDAAESAPPPTRRHELVRRLVFHLRRGLLRGLRALERRLED